MKQKGKIKRPPGCKEPIIRITGTPENHSTDGEVIIVPDIPPDWDEVLHGIFSECHDTPLRKAGGELRD